MTVRAAIEKARAQNAKKYRDVSFLDGSPYSMQFMFSEYSYSTVQSGVINSDNSNGSVTLPLPQNLQDSYGVNVGTYELGASGALIASASQGKTDLSGVAREWEKATSGFAGIGSELMTQGGNFIDGTPVNFSGITSQGRDMFSTISAASAYAGRNLLDSLPFGFAGGVAVGRGTAINPHQALRFEGVNLKNYNFSWTLAPKSREEADKIASMINEIKANMHPEYQEDDSRLLFKYPSLVQPIINGISPEHTFTFNLGMISGLTVDYTPSGMALNRGGIPSMINLSFQFTEAKIKTRKDFSA